MEKMKSALEIALEKAKKLGSQTKKEAKGEVNQKYIQAALSLGNSFLQGKTGAKKIKESLSRYPEESREDALKAFLTTITEEMSLAGTPEILDAVLLLKEEAGVQEACHKVKAFHRQLLQQLKEKKAALQKSSFEPLLKKMGLEGIKGSALAGFNTQHLPGWEETEAQLLAEYQELARDFSNTLLGPQEQ